MFVVRKGFIVTLGLGLLAALVVGVRDGLGSGVCLFVLTLVLYWLARRLPID